MVPDIMLTGPGSTIAKARRLRRTMSLPEVLLWQEVRKRPDGFKWRKQHRAGPFILDFVCLEARLAIEVDGEAHDRGSNPAHDEARDEWLMAQGYRTLRIPARDILGNMEGALAHILAHCPPLHHPPAADGPPPRTGED
jgi:very-short-patch-repair endonuclease